ncbi:MAG: cysteine desulfurase [Verrucomicrobiales bacterium]|nr:cysteine desulfurase [Verrucomicrobiales bacterium]
MLRRQFPALDQTVHGHPLVYLDNAATTHKPQQVIRTLTRFYERDNANVHRAIHELAERSTIAFEAARARVARFLKAKEPAEIVFTRGTTEAINLVAQSWGRRQLRAGDQILLSPLEHHSNLVPWQMLCRQTGAELRFLPLDRSAQEVRWDQLVSLLTPQVKLLAFTHLSNVLGTVSPVSEVCAVARARGVVTLVDAAQSAGHLPLDVQDLNCDFLAFSGHKVYGPTGIGVLYGRKERLLTMDPWQGGGEMIENVSWLDSTFAPPPQRFEAGTPAIAEAIGLHAALDFLDQIGRPSLERQERELTHLALEQLEALPGLRVLGSRENRSGVLSFTLEGVHAHDLVTFANERGIALRSGHHCAQPLLSELGLSSVARASLALYNTPQDIDRLVSATREALTFFA